MTELTLQQRLRPLAARQLAQRLYRATIVVLALAALCGLVLVTVHVLYHWWSPLVVSAWLSASIVGVFTTRSIIKKHHLVNFEPLAKDVERQHPE
jgi:hypothetical protein